MTLENVPRRFRNDEPPVADAPGGAGAAGRASASDADTAVATPNWFADFLNDRATRAHDEGVPSRLHCGGRSNLVGRSRVD